MKIAYTMSPGRGDTDLLLADLAEALLDRGLRPVGTVQFNTDCGTGNPCDMDVKTLPDGPVIRISQSLGPHAKGCRLDAGALEQAVALVEAALAEGADCLIVNKFGKQEAEGRGFRPLIAEALSRGMPVLVGLNRLNAAPFDAFTEGLAEVLPPRPQAILDWLTEAITARAEAG